MGPYVISALITGHTLETKISVIVSLIMEKSGNTIIIVYPERQSKGAKRKLAASGPDTDSDQTKFLRQEGGGGSSRGGAGYGKAKGRGRAEDSAQVPPGTVTRHGIADPEYLTLDGPDPPAAVRIDHIPGSLRALRRGGYQDGRGGHARTRPGGWSFGGR